MIYRVVFLTVPPNFQYQNEKRWAANPRFCSMKFSMYKRSLLVEQRFLFSTEIWAEQLKKQPLCHRMVSYQNLESLHLLKLGGAEDEVALAVTCDSLVIGHILPHINTPEGLNYQATKTYP